MSGFLGFSASEIARPNHVESPILLAKVEITIFADGDLIAVNDRGDEVFSQVRCWLSPGPGVIVCRLTGSDFAFAVPRSWLDGSGEIIVRIHGVRHLRVALLASIIEARLSIHSATCTVAGGRTSQSEGRYGA